jgi:hypothetical protein
MSGIDEVLEDFDMFVTPIHDGPSIGSGLTQGPGRSAAFLGVMGNPRPLGFPDLETECCVCYTQGGSM